MEESKLKQTTSPKHKIAKTRPDAAMATPFQDLPIRIFPFVYYLNPRLSIYLSIYIVNLVIFIEAS